MSTFMSGMVPVTITSADRLDCLTSVETAVCYVLCLACSVLVSAL